MRGERVTRDVFQLPFTKERCHHTNACQGYHRGRPAGPGQLISGFPGDEQHVRLRDRARPASVKHPRRRAQVEQERPPATIAAREKERVSAERREGIRGGAAHLDDEWVKVGA